MRQRAFGVAPRHSGLSEQMSWPVGPEGTGVVERIKRAGCLLDMDLGGRG